MRLSRRPAALLVLFLAYPISIGCSGNGLVETGGSGGAPDHTSSVTGSVGEGGFGVGGGFGGSGGMGASPYVWTRHYGDAEDQTVSAMAMSPFAEIALVGTAKGTVDFGNIPWDGTTTDTDVVVAKISGKGQALWSRRFGDLCDQQGGAVAITPSGNVVIAGDFCGKMDFGTTTIETKPTERDLFVAVFDTLGQDEYSRAFGGKGAQIARAAAVHSNGDTVIVGTFDQVFDDGTGPVSSVGMDDIFILDLDSKGNLLWSQTFGGAEADTPRAVAFDAKGNIVIGGSFGDSVDFGGGPLTAPAGHPGAFLISLDPSGKHLWSQSFASEDASLNGLSIGSDDSIAFTGTFTGSIDFGSGPSASEDASDVFLAQVDSAGQPLSGKTFGGLGSQRGIGVAFGADGALAYTGTATEAIDLGGGFKLGAQPPYGPEMVYVVEVDSSGNYTSQWTVGCADPMTIAGVGFGSQQYVTVAGSFKSPFNGGFNDVEPAGGWDMFLLRR